MSIIESILDSVALQQLQLCLAFWQIVKSTPVGGFIKGIIACLLLPLIRLLQPFGLSPTIARLQCFHGRLFKRVRCHVIRAPEPMAPPACRQIDDQLNKLPSQYLGKKFVLERKEGNRLLVNGIMCYYITDAIWASLLDMAQKAPSTVFLNCYEKVWEQTVVGCVMSLEQVLDSLILENQYMKALDNAWLLPAKLSESDDPLLSILNFVGIILQIYTTLWLTPSLLSIMSAVLEFIAPLKKWLYGKINFTFCCAMHLICDQLPYSVRRRVYVFGCWVKNLKPSNDIKLKVVRNDTIYAVIAGGAKAYNEDATLVQGWSQFLGQVDEAAASVPISIEKGATLALVPQFSLNEENTFKCAHIDIKCKRRFDSHDDYCIEASSHGVAIIEFVIKSRTRDDFLKMCTFLSCISQNRSGSLKCQHSDKKLCVRTFRESIMCYVRNGYPPVYTLEFQNATVL